MLEISRMEIAREIRRIERERSKRAYRTPTSQAVGIYAGKLSVWRTLLERLNRAEAADAERFVRHQSRCVRRAWILAGAANPADYLYRERDPESSRLSALYGEPFRPAIRDRLLEALLRLGSGTVRQVCKAAGLSYHSGERRFSDLVNLGLVMGTGELVETEAGGKAEVYRPSSAAGRTPQMALAI